MPVPIEYDKSFKEEREPLIEYEVIKDEHKDPFIPAVEAKMDKEGAVVHIEL